MIQPAARDDDRTGPGGVVACVAGAGGGQRSGADSDQPAAGPHGRNAGPIASAETAPVQVGAHAMVTLTRRSDFLRAASARRQGTPGFLLQARRRSEGEAPTTIRIGFTCSKKLGNAVTRNRAKRRLRAVVRDVLPDAGRPGWDYVMVGRPGATVERAFTSLLADLQEALGRIHGADPAR